MFLPLWQDAYEYQGNSHFQRDMHYDVNMSEPHIEADLFYYFLQWYSH